MIPRTKLQVRVFSLSKQLPSLHQEQEKWAFNECLDHVGYRTKTKISCLDCGNVWPGPQKVKSCICPKCNTKLTIRDTLKRNLDQTNIVFAIVDVVAEFQLVRYFEIYSYHKAGNIPKQHTREIVQQWFVPDGKLTIVGKMNSYNCGFSGNMEIRANITNYYTSNKYNIWAYKIYPEAKCLPIYKRNGFTSKIHDIYPYTFFGKLLRDSKVETLLKSGQFDLLSARLGNRESAVYKHWDSIKICIRNKYIVKDAASYLDYLDMLHEAGKDLRSSKYVCPANFKREHNRYVAKRSRIERAQQADRNRQAAERRKIRAEEEQSEYLKQKAQFFGMVISDGPITVKVLESIQEFIAESETHGHCVYTNSYYNKIDSLCLSAMVNGERMETLEVSLKEMKIVQARGAKNKPSPYHDQILSLVKKNMHIIKKRSKVKLDQVAA